MLEQKAIQPPGNLFSFRTLNRFTLKLILDDCKSTDLQHIHTQLFVWQLYPDGFQAYPIEVFAYMLLKIIFYITDVISVDHVQQLTFSTVRIKIFRCTHLFPILGFNMGTHVTKAGF